MGTGDGRAGSCERLKAIGGKERKAVLDKVVVESEDHSYAEALHDRKARGVGE